MEKIHYFHPLVGRGNFSFGSEKKRQVRIHISFVWFAKQIRNGFFYKYQWNKIFRICKSNRIDIVHEQSIQKGGNGSSRIPIILYKFSCAMVEK